MFKGESLWIPVGRFYVLTATSHSILGTAGAGSLILEFATLSRLTGDERFEKVAYKAYFALWNRKSDLGLVANTINIWTGVGTISSLSFSTIPLLISGSVMDTSRGHGDRCRHRLFLRIRTEMVHFKWCVIRNAHCIKVFPYSYAIGEVEFLDVWQEGYAAVMRHVRSLDGHWVRLRSPTFLLPTDDWFQYRIVNPHTGDQVHTTIDSLSAFWPGLQVLGGDIPNAIKSHLTCE